MLFKKEKNKTYIITGGAGFIGSNLAKIFNNRTKAIIVDNFSSGSHNNISSIIERDNYNTFVEHKRIEDVDWDVFLRKTKPDGVFHMAANSSTSADWSEELYQSNVGSFQRICEACVQKNVPLVYASSASVYGVNDPCPLSIFRTRSPKNAYAVSKALMESVAHEIKRNNRKALIAGIRYFNVYGPGEESKGKMSSLIYQMYNTLKEGREVELFEKKSQNARDFVFVTDAAQFTYNLMEKIVEDKSISYLNCVYNCGTGESRTFEEAAHILGHNMKQKVKIKEIAIPEEIRGSYQKHTRAKMCYGMEFFPNSKPYVLEDGIRIYVQYLNKKNKEEE